MVSSKSLRHILKFDISKELSTLKEDASASFFRLGRTLALGPQDC